MPIGDLLAQITGEPKSSPTQGASREPVHHPVKRKPEAQTRKQANTSQTITSISSNSRNTGLSNRHTAFSSSPQTRQVRDLPSAADCKPYVSSNNQNTTTLPNGPTKPPKKGSYAEIMARGKAAHANLGQVGKILHKNIERPPSKREREDIKGQRSHKLQKTLNPNNKTLKQDLTKGRDVGKPVPEPPKKIKKSALATTGYTGTARPKPSSLSKTSRASQAKVLHTTYDRRRVPSEQRYRHKSGDHDEEEDEEDEEEEEVDYESDLSDMEAAAFEVDEEEETAAKIARREDAEALAEENRLKREKEARRKKLTTMA